MFFIFHVHNRSCIEPVDVVLLEGWMLGFDPLDKIDIITPSPGSTDATNTDLHADTGNIDSVVVGSAGTTETETETEQPVVASSIDLKLRNIQVFSLFSVQKHYALSSFSFMLCYICACINKP